MSLCYKYLVILINIFLYKLVKMSYKKKILISASPFCEHDKTPLHLLRSSNIKYNLNPKKRKLKEREILKLIKSYDGLIADVEPLNKKYSPQQKI